MAGWHHHESIEKSQEILDIFIDEDKTFAICLKENGKVIGSLGIEEYSEENYPELDSLQGREIGYVLSKPYWGQGLMPEAVNAVIDWLFNDVQLDFIIVGHFDRNARSKRVVEKCGFQYIKNTKFETRYDTVESSLEYILYHPERRESRC